MAKIFNFLNFFKHWLFDTESIRKQTTTTTKTIVTDEYKGMEENLLIDFNFSKQLFKIFKRKFRSVWDPSLPWPIRLETI